MRPPVHVLRDLPLTIRFLLALVVPLSIASMIVGWITYNSLTNNASRLSAALEDQAHAQRVVALVLVQEDASKAILLNPMKIGDYSKAKLAAYDEHKVLLDRLLVETEDAVVGDMLGQLARIDSEALRPLDTRILEQLFVDADEARRIYLEEYEPKRHAYEAIVGRLATHTSNVAEEATHEMADENATSLLEVCGVLFLAVATITGAIVVLGRRVEKHEAALEEKEAAMRVVLDNTADGLIPVGVDGVIRPGVSARVGEWFGSDGGGQPFWELVHADDDRAQILLEMGYGQLVADLLPRDMLLHQIPKELHHEGRDLRLSFRNIVQDGERAGFIIGVADVTAEVAAQRAQAQAKEHQEILMHALTAREAFDSFVVETQRLLLGAASETDRPTLLRLLHTLKGNTAIYGFGTFSGVVHAAEDRLIENPTCHPGPIVAELDSAWKHAFGGIAEILGRYTVSGLALAEEDVEALLRAIRTGRSAEDLTQLVHQWRHEPIGCRLAELSRATERLADRTGKEVTVSVEEHGRLRLPADAYGPVWSNLVHLLRNCVDHGIESPEDRTAAGKPRTGTIGIHTRLVGPDLLVDITDDGRGIDWARLEAKGAEKGIPSDGSAEARIAILFADGVSTRDAATDVSGRGVGMGALRGAVLALGGRIEVDSERGRGTRVRLVLPGRAGSAAVAPVAAASA